MSAGHYDFEIEQGATFTLNLSYKDSNGAVINLTSPTPYTGRMKIRDSPDGELIASSESADSPLNIITVTIGASGNNIVASMTATNTKTLDFDTGVYDLEIYNGTGSTQVVERIIEGRVTLDKSVSS